MAKRMAGVTRRGVLAGGAMLSLPWIARADDVKPRVTAISQWSAGSDGAAITALGKLFEQNGGIWQHNPVPGFTTEMMNKLRAEIMAGDPPAASQLKGPEIAAWSKIAPTVDLDAAGSRRRISNESRRAGTRESCTSRTGIGSRCRCSCTASTRCSSPHKGWSARSVTKAAGDLGRV